jgi:hypothetical protein
MSKADKNFYHNKGQEDKAKGKAFNSPSKFIDWFDPSSERLKKTDENTKSYRKGWNNNRN